MKQTQFKTTLNAIAEQGIPTTTDLWPEISAKIAVPTKRPYQQLPFTPILRTALGVAVLVLAVGIGLWVAKPQPVSAAEIIQRSLQANTGIQSFTGVIVSKQPLEYDYQTQSAQLQYKSYIWFQRPGYTRIETYGYVNPNVEGPHLPGENAGASYPLALSKPDDSAQLYFSNLQVDDGKWSWSVVPSEKAAYQLDSSINSNSAAVPNLLNTRSFYGGVNTDLQANSLDSLINQTGQHFEEAKLLGEDKLAGRNVYVIQLLKKPKGAITDLAIKYFTLWIDKETYLQLGNEIKNGQGKVEWNSQYVEFNLNPAIEHSVFTFTSSKEVRIVDFTTRSMPNETELDRIWQELPLKMRYYHLYKPTVIPLGLIATRPDYDLYTITQGFNSKSTIGAIWLVEGAGANGYYDGIGPKQGTAITIGTDAGYYIDWGTKRVLSWKREGTALAIVGQGDVTKEDLFKMAESMKPVPIQNRANIEATATPVESK